MTSYRKVVGWVGFEDAHGRVYLTNDPAELSLLARIGEPFTLYRNDDETRRDVIESVVRVVVEAEK